MCLESAFPINSENDATGNPDLSTRFKCSQHPSHFSWYVAVPRVQDADVGFIIHAAMAEILRYLVATRAIYRTNKLKQCLGCMLFAQGACGVEKIINLILSDVDGCDTGHRRCLGELAA